MNLHVSVVLLGQQYINIPHVSVWWCTYVFVLVGCDSKEAGGREGEGVEVGPVHSVNILSLCHVDPGLVSVHRVQ